MTQTDWSSFFVAQVGAAAALIGLLFVSLSINLKQIVEMRYLVDTVGEALLIFLLPFLIAIFGLIPHQSAGAFGSEILGVGIVFEALAARLQVRRFRSRPPEAKLVGMVIWMLEMQAATISTIVAGLLLATGHDYGFGWLVPAVLSSYLAGITSAWVLTIEILR